MAELSGYRIMWIFCMFDLPTRTKAERRTYAQFRKLLLEHGFQMMQYSVYARHCMSREYAKVYEKTVKDAIPEDGLVDIIMITDRQFGMIHRHVGKKKQDLPSRAEQLLLF